MKTNKTLPMLEKECISDTIWRFCIQKILKYDDTNYSVYSDYIGVWDSATGDIDKAMENIYRQEKEFCDNNKYIKPFTFTLRKVAVECKMEVIGNKIETHFGDNNYQPLYCAACGRTIQYGDGFLTDAMADVVYCDAECFMKSRNVIQHDSQDDDYESHFISK